MSAGRLCRTGGGRGRLGARRTPAIERRTDADVRLGYGLVFARVAKPQRFTI